MTDVAPSSITSVRLPHRGSVHGIALYRINSPDWAGSERKSAAVRLQRFVPPAVKIVLVEGTRMQRVRYPLRHLFAMRAYGGNFYFDMRGSAIAIAAQCSIRFFDDTQLFGEIAVPCKSFRGSCSFFLRPARSLPASSLLPPSPRPDRPGPTLRWRMVRPNCVWSFPSPASFIHSLACLRACGRPEKSSAGTGT